MFKKLLVVVVLLVFSACNRGAVVDLETVENVNGEVESEVMVTQGADGSYDIVDFVGVRGYFAVDENGFWLGEGEPSFCEESMYVPDRDIEGEYRDFWHYVDAGMSAHAFAEINSEGKVGDRLTVNWYYQKMDLDGMEEMGPLGEKKLIFSEEVEVFEACDGGLWAYSKMENGDEEELFGHVFGAKYVVVFSRDGKEIGSRIYGYAQ